MTKMTRTLTWSGKCFWISNNILIIRYSTNVSSCLESRFSVVVKECDEIYHLGRNEWFEFIAIWQLLHVPEDQSCRRYSFSREGNFCWIMIILLWKYSSCYSFLNARVDRPDWKSIFPPPRRVAYEWTILDRIVHPEISWEWVMTTL